MNEVETKLRERLAELWAQRERLDVLISETEESISRHERARVRQEKVMARDQKWFRNATEDERATAWLRMQPGIGKVTADRLLIALGGSWGLWDKVRSGRVLSVKVPWTLREKLRTAERPPWNEEEW